MPRLVPASGCSRAKALRCAARPLRPASKQLVRSSSSTTSVGTYPALMRADTNSNRLRQDRLDITRDSGDFVDGLVNWAANGDPKPSLPGSGQMRGRFSKQGLHL